MLVELIWIAILFLLVWLSLKLIPFFKTQIVKAKINSLVSENSEITPEEFFMMRKQRDKKGEKYISADYNFIGVYILFNKTKGIYYVGQATKILDRVNNHFTGKGNGDVYADYKYGDKFIIKLIPLKDSGYTTLNSLEKASIVSYNSYYKGYNKTRGNK